MTTTETHFRRVEITNEQFSDVLVNESYFGIHLVRKQFPTLLAMNVTSVQPLTQPVGLAYAMWFAYNMNTDYRSVSISNFELTNEYSIYTKTEENNESIKYNFFKQWLKQ